jgi:hypothetical protein
MALFVAVAAVVKTRADNTPRVRFTNNLIEFMKELSGLSVCLRQGLFVFFMGWLPMIKQKTAGAIL